MYQSTNMRSTVSRMQKRDLGNASRVRVRVAVIDASHVSCFFVLRGTFNNVIAASIAI